MTDTTTPPVRTASGLNGDGPARGHLGELGLRRLFAGELGDAERAEAEAHVAACVECAARIPGPAAPARARWWTRPTSTWSFVSVFSLGAVASAAALIVTARPLFQEARVRTAANLARGTSRLKGGDAAALTVRVAPPDDGPQRIAAVNAPEPLGTGERLRIGVRAGGRRYLFAITVDDTGLVTPLYPETGISVALPPGEDLQYLPESVELTGRGRERLVVVLTDEPTELDILRRAVVASFAKARGDLMRLPDLALVGDQFHRTFIKP